ncbi:MAG: LacI family transcriptional regulator [Calditrichaeota bacterium]|nr:LacI family transcriptional regulator [Calditrichota bacterium]
MQIREIARLAGVSVATVSRVINGKGPVKEKTRRRILEIMKEHNYVPNPIARSLSTHHTDTIGVILPELVDEFFSDLIRGMDVEATKSNKYLMVTGSHSKKNIAETLLEFMTSGRVDGVIVMAPLLHREISELLAFAKCPVVMINSCLDEEQVVSFNINNIQGAEMITKHLIGHGFERIGMILGPKNNFDAEQRFAGFKKAIESAGLTIENSLLIPGDFATKSGFEAFYELLQRSPKPEAIFAANDMMAIGAYEAARKMGVRIPEDVAIAGFDDIFISRFLKPRLTTVHVPIVELGQKAMKYLLKMIEGEVDSTKPYREDMETKIVIGGSCGCDTNNADEFV